MHVELNPAVREALTAMYGPAIAHRGVETKSSSPNPLAPKTRSENPSLSELNPLLNPLDLPSSADVDAFKTVTLNLIDARGGLSPSALKSMLVFSEEAKAAEYRFIARFDVGSLTKKKIKHLEDLVRFRYGQDTRTTTSTDGVPIPAVRYPPADTRSVDEMVNTRYEGWYMGPNTTPLNALHSGVYLFRDVGVTNAKNFLDASQVKNPNYLVEIREQDIFQTDLATMIVEVASILGKGKPVDYGQLLYDAYYSLMRSSLKNEEAGYGIEELLKPVRRGLILPLANPELAKSIGQEPESAIFCGVPGTGKSMAARKLMFEDTGVFIIPTDPLQISNDLKLPPEKRKIIPRIAEVKRQAGRSVILQLDDMEKLGSKESDVNATLLNLMEGVRELGFYVMASTNNPEEIAEALLQPQRFGIRVYCPLPGYEARLHMLDQHTPKSTPETASELFESQKIRQIILQFVAKNTENFPPRQLSKIATNAKGILIERVAEQAGQNKDLTEHNLNGETFTIDDWLQALAKTLETFDKSGTIKKDEAIRKFVIHNDQGRGMALHDMLSSGKRDYDEVRREIAAAQAESGTAF